MSPPKKSARLKQWLTQRLRIQWLRIICSTLLCLLSSVVTANHNPAVTLCVDSGPEILDPAYSIATVDAMFLGLNIYEPLLLREADGLKPNLAEAWEELSPNQHYRFTLRRKVAFHGFRKFQPSRHLNAEDVVYSLGRLVDNRSTDFRFAKNTLIKAVDEYTVELRTPEPVDELLMHLSTNYAAIVSAEYAQLHPDKVPPTQFPGTGPYRVARHASQSLTLFERFDDYWGDKAKTNYIKIETLQNQGNRFTALRRGKCQLAFDLSPAYWENASLIKGLKSSPSGVNGTALMFFNTVKSPTNQLKLRRAIAHAIDRDKILRLLKQPQLQPARSLVPTELLDQSSVESIPFDLIRAKALMAELDKPPKTLHIEFKKHPNISFPFPQRIADLIAADLEKIDIKATFTFHESIQDLIKAMFADEMRVSIVEWVTDLPSANDFLQPLLSCPGAGTQATVSQWCSEEFDQLLARAKSEQDPRHYITAASLANQQVPAIPLWHTGSRDLYSDKLSGYSGGYFIDLKELALTP